MVLLLMCLWRCVYVFQINYGVIFLFLFTYGHIVKYTLYTARQAEVVPKCTPKAAILMFSRDFTLGSDYLLESTSV